MKINNKRNRLNNWVAFDRSLMRDKRIKSNTKTMYLLFDSLSQSCNNVYISYSYIAEEVGYEYKGKYEKGTKEYEDAMKKFVVYNLQPLIDLGWIKKTNKQGETCDWDVFDHDCEEYQKSTSNPGEKSPHTREKNLHTHPGEKSPLSYKRVELEERVRSTAPAFPKLSTLDKATHKEVFDVVNELFPELNKTPFLRIIVEILIKIPDWHEYALYVQKNKSERYLEVGGWRKWFYEDYLVDKHRPIDTKNTLTPEEEQRMIELGEKYGYDFTEPKEDKNKMTFDDYLLEAKVAKKYKMAGFTPHPSVAHLWDTLEVEEEKEYNFV